jgi:TonB family protein
MIFNIHFTNNYKPLKQIEMKTIKITLMTIGLFLMVSALSVASVSEKGFTEKIRTEVSYPRAAFDQNIEGMVLISFIVDEQGNIQIDGVNASHAELRDYVVNIIKNTQVSFADEAYGKRFNMKFVFHIL